MKKFLRVLYRFVLFLPGLAVQIFFYFLLFSWLKDYAVIVWGVTGVYQLASLVYIINKREEANYKVLWAICMLLLPFVGSWLYLLAGNHKTSRPIEKRLRKNKQPFVAKNLILDSNSTTNRTLNLIQKVSGMPISPLDDPKFYALGEDMFEDIKKDLQNAKHFVFIEYFIIENGKFWGEIVDILKQKVKEGVVVKVLFDDIGSFATYSFKSRRKLKKAGIDVAAFNPAARLRFSLNNRDHKKIMIIDNTIAYSGGINIADEYINHKQRFGHWKDIGFSLRGEAVQTFTHLFTTFWNAYSKNKIDHSTLFTPDNVSDQTTSKVLTYCDSPSNDESISNKFFIDILSTAEKYVFFYTPYLILNDSLKDAFIQASERQIDVRIIIPKTPDKKHVYMLTLRNAEELSKYGVKIFLYEKGFVHAKAAIVDDRLCSIGTVNLDFRSLFLHYENNSIFDDPKMLTALKEDFVQTQSTSNLFVPKKRNIFVRIYRSLINIFSPLL